MKYLLPILMLFCACSVQAQCTAPTITATVKGPDQINLTWAAASTPCYGYLVEIQSAGDSRYSSFTQFQFIPTASGDGNDENRDPTCSFCFNVSAVLNGLPTWVVESQYVDPQDNSAAQAIIYGLKNNTSYSFRVRTYKGYTSTSYSLYSNTATATTSNYTLRYVNTATGNDANNGTNSTTLAWATIQHACSVATAGQMVIIIGGNYANDKCFAQVTGSSGIGNKIVFEANPGDTVTLTGTLVSSGFGPLNTNGGTNIVFDGINSTEIPDTGANYIILSGGHNVVFGGQLDDRNKTGALINSSNNLVQGVYMHDTGTAAVDAGDILDIACNGAQTTNFNVVQYNHFTRGSHGNTLILNQSCGVGSPNNNELLNNITDGGLGNAFEEVEQAAQSGTTHDLTEGNICYQVYTNAGNSDFKECLIDYGVSNTMRRNIDINSGPNVNQTPQGTHGMEINALHGNTTGGLYYNNVFYKVSGRCYWFGGTVSGTYANQVVANNICTRGGISTDSDYSTNGVLESWGVQVATASVTHNDFLYYSGSSPVPTQTILGYFQGATLRTMTYADANFNPPFSNNAILQVDPQYVNEAGFDFHLQTTSPLVGAAASITDATWGTISNTNLGAFDGSFNPESPNGAQVLSPGVTLTPGASVR